MAAVKYTERLQTEGFPIERKERVRCRVKISFLSLLYHLTTKLSQYLLNVSQDQRTTGADAGVAHELRPEMKQSRVAGFVCRVAACHHQPP